MVNGLDNKAEGRTNVQDVFLHDPLHNRRLASIVESAASGVSNSSCTDGGAARYTDSISIRISLSFNLAFLNIESISTNACLAMEAWKLLQVRR